MALPKLEVRTYFGQCKCCLNYAYLKNMWEQHPIEGERLIIYGKMLVECFSLSWTIRDKVEDDKICEECISKLQDAFSFKKQVLESQKELLNKNSLNEIEISRVEAEIVDENVEPSDVALKAYEDIEFLEEDLLDEGPSQNDDETEDPKTDTKKKSPRAMQKGDGHKAYKQYTEVDLSMAIEAVRSKELTLREAGEKYNIPRKTVSAKMKSLMENKEPGTENLLRKKMSEFIRGIQSILTHTNATPFRCKGNQYFCMFCRVNSPDFDDPKDLRKHTHTKHTGKVKQIEFAMRPHHYNEMLRLDVEDLTCNCKKKGTWLEMLEHLKVKHDVSIEETKKRVIPYRLTPNEMPCAICDYRSAFTSMDSHMNSHYSNYICGDCGDSFITSARLNNHIKIHRIGIYPCNKCDKMFSREMYRRKHINMVHDRKPLFKCSHCGERFATDKLRFIHMNSEHKDKLDIKARTCKECKKTFSWGADYSRHMRRSHHMSYTCEECGKSFEGHKLLEEHKLRHAGVKKYECDVCRKPYFSQAAVYMHKKCKHREQTEDAGEQYPDIKVEIISMEQE